MEFSPTNKTVMRCLHVMNLGDPEKNEEAVGILKKAWEEAADEGEKFLVAFFLARRVRPASEKLAWLNTSLELAVRINDDTVKDALPAIYAEMANCYIERNDAGEAERYRNLAESSVHQPSDPGPFYHGTRADLKIGDLLVPGHQSNYSADLFMNHIYFTALVNGAGLAAALAKGDAPERVYIVEPTGDFESDPNVTNKKFPGNPTRSYRTTSPLKVVGELKEWTRITPEEIQKWREKLDENKGEIIN